MAHSLGGHNIDLFLLNGGIGGFMAIRIIGLVLFFSSLWIGMWGCGFFWREHFGFWSASAITMLSFMGYGVYLLQHPLKNPAL